MVVFKAFFEKCKEMKILIWRFPKQIIAIKSNSKSLDADIKKIEKQLEVYISEDSNLEKIYTQITSVPGVGNITALLLICFTNEFTLFNTPRELVCYCGVVPFEYTSGKSVRAKPNVHFMANKKLKNNCICVRCQALLIILK